MRQLNLLPKCENIPERGASHINRNLNFRHERYSNDRPWTCEHYDDVDSGVRQLKLMADCLTLSLAPRLACQQRTQLRA